MKKKAAILIMMIITFCGYAQERGDNLIIARVNIESERDIMLEVNRQLTVNGWSVAKADMDFLFIETNKREMKRFDTDLVLHISVSAQNVYIRGNWFNEFVFGTEAQRMGFARARSNVQNEMWLTTMQLVNALKPESITYQQE